MPKEEKYKVDRWVYNELKRIVGLKPWHVQPELDKFFVTLAPFSQRTGQQNRALHKFFSMLAESLNLAGLEMRVVLKEETKIWWTTHAVKEYLWKPVQKAMFGKESTTELEKQVEIDKIHEQLMHLLGEKHGVEWIDFPVDKQEEIGEVEYPDYQGPSTLS